MSTVQSLAIALGAGVPTVLWGPPGSGKTSAINALAASSSMPCEAVIASIREPSDFAGLPVVGGDGSVRFAPPLWARRLSEAGRGILFLDEISTAPPAVQAALLRVVLERAVGDLQLPDDVVVVAAANPPEQAADGWDLAAPLANRFCHLDWQLDARAWVSGVVSGFEHAVIPTLDPLDLERAAIVHRSRIGSFISARTSMLSVVPKDGTRAGRAWPSPRSWTMAATLSAAAELVGADRSTASELMSGAIGPAAAMEFLAWIDEAALPDPEEALRNPDAFELPERGDRAFAALNAIVAAVRADNTPERWSAAWTAIAAGVRQGQADLAVAVMRPLVEHRPDGAMPTAAALAVVAPVLREAGLLDQFAPPSR
jgi:MoxR-like ATPase